MKNSRNKYFTSTLICLALLFFSGNGFAIDSHANWSASAKAIEKALNEALSTYHDGKSEEATEMVADTYFGLFESEKANMEIAVRRFISFKVAVKIEKSFNKLRKAMHTKEAMKDIKDQTTALIADVKEAAAILDEKGVGMNPEYKR